MSEDKLKLFQLFESDDINNHWLAWEMCKGLGITFDEIFEWYITYSKRYEIKHVNDLFESYPCKIYLYTYLFFGLSINFKIGKSFIENGHHEHAIKMFIYKRGEYNSMWFDQGTEMKDFSWKWPGDFAEHYVLKHKVKPTDEFLEFIGYIKN